MALRDFRIFSWVPIYFNNAYLIDASGEKVANIFQVPKTGTITKVYFRVSVVTSAQTLRLSLQTLDSSDNPSGSNYGGSAAGTQTSPAANTGYVVTLGTPCSAVQGDFIAAVVEFDSTVGNLSITGMQHPLNVSRFPCVAHYTTSWAKQAQSLPIIGLEYSDGNVEWFPSSPHTVYDTVAYNANSTPDEYGIRLYFNVQASIKGASIAAFAAAGDTFKLCLYRGTTILEQKTINTNHLDSAATRQCHFLFNSDYTLDRQVEYVLSVQPVSTSNNLTLQRALVTANKYLNGYALGKECYLMSRTNEGSWSASTDRVPAIMPIFSKFNDGIDNVSFNEGLT